MKESYKHIVITGASSGIGEALALFYAARGVTLSLSGRDSARLDFVAEACRARGAAVQAEILDVTDESGMRAWLESRDHDLPVDLVIANAGISGGTGGAPDGETLAQLKALFAVNVEGVFHTIHPLLPRMIERGSGQIALMGSLAGLRGWPGAPGYCASKAALRVYAQALRAGLADYGVKVNLIGPGFVVSRMTDANDFPMPFLMPADKAARIIAKGLKRNRNPIYFPAPAAFFSCLFSFLPDSLWLKSILRKIPSKRNCR